MLQVKWNDVRRLITLPDSIYREALSRQGSPGKNPPQNVLKRQILTYSFAP